MIKFRTATRLAAYFAVGFVLIFLGKISKAELVQNYRRSIGEVTSRNSQDISHLITGNLELQAAPAPKPVTPALFAGIIAVFTVAAPAQPSNWNLPQAPASTLSPTEMLLSVQPAMAP